MSRSKRRLKLPPYSKDLAAARLRNLVPPKQEWHVVISMEWRDPAPRWPVVVCPPGKDPFDYDWRFLAGLEVLVMHRDQDEVTAYQLMSALFQSRADRVVMFNMDHPHFWRFVPKAGAYHA